VFPQPPQWFSSVCGSMQLPLQFRKPAGQHRPEEHVSFDPQLRPQEPQLLASERRSTHRPLQAVRPVGQRHVPDTQLMPPLHRR
jgi:hypothetical protein